MDTQTTYIIWKDTPNDPTGKKLMVESLDALGVTLEQAKESQGYITHISVSDPKEAFIFLLEFTLSYFSMKEITPSLWPAMVD